MTGLSLAMNSANSETKNRIRNSQNDTWPRRLALKFSQRRWLIGESEKRERARRGRLSAAPDSTEGVRASTSDLPRLEIDARIDQHVGQVADEIHREREQREDIEVREHDRIVAVEHAFETEQSEAVEREDRLDQQRAGEEGVDEGAGEARDHDQHRVAEDVTVENLS